MTRRGRVTRGVTAIASGTLIGQLVLVGVTPLLARIYSPEAFGAFSVILGIATIVGPAAALKYDTGVILPAEEDDARRMLRSALISVLGVSVISGLVVWALSTTQLAESWRGVDFAPLWCGALVLVTGVFGALTQAALRIHAYGAVARRTPIQSVGVAVGQLGAGLIAPTATGLLAGSLVGRTVGIFPLLRTSRGLLRRPAPGGYRPLLREYWRLPAVLAPSGVLNALGLQLPVLIIASIYGASAAGEIGMAQRIVGIPTTVLGASIAQVLVAEFAQRLRAREGGLRTYYLRASGWLGLIGIATGIGLFLLSPWVLSVFLGDDWTLSAEFAQALSITVAAGLVASPLSQVYLVYQSLATVIVDISRVLLLIAAAGVAVALDWDAVEATWLMAGTMVLTYAASWGYGLRMVTRRSP